VDESADDDREVFSPSLLLSQRQTDGGNRTANPDDDNANGLPDAALPSCRLLNASGLPLSSLPPPPRNCRRGLKVPASRARAS